MRVPAASNPASNPEKKANEQRSHSSLRSHSRTTGEHSPCSVKNQVSLTVLGGHYRVKADLALPSEEDGSHSQYLDDED